MNLIPESNGYQPTGGLAGVLASQQQTATDNANQSNFDQQNLENIVKQRDAMNAQAEMSPEFQQSRLAGLMGQSQSAQAKGAFDMSTLDARTKATLADNYLKTDQDTRAREKIGLENFIAAYKANGPAGFSTALDTITDPNMKQQAIKLAQTQGPEAVYNLANSMHDMYTQLEADTPTHRNKMSEIGLQGQNALTVEQTRASSNERLQAAHDAERLEAAKIRAQAVMAGKTAALNRLSKVPTDSAIYDEQQILGSAEPSFNDLDTGSKKAAAKDVFLKAKELYKANAGDESYTEEQAYNDARTAVLGNIKQVPGRIYGTNPTYKPTSANVQAPVSAQQNVSFAPDPGYTPTPEHIQALQKAVDAIKSGKNPAMVNARLREHGILVNVQ